MLGDIKGVSLFREVVRDTVGVLYTKDSKLAVSLIITATSSSLPQTKVLKSSHRASHGFGLFGPTDVPLTASDLVDLLISDYEKDPEGFKKELKERGVNGLDSEEEEEQVI